MTVPDAVAYSVLHSKPCVLILQADQFLTAIASHFDFYEVVSFFFSSASESRR